MEYVPSYTILIGSTHVPVVTTRADIDLSKAVASSQLISWAKEMTTELAEHPEMKLEGSIIVTDMDMFGPRVGFLKFSANVTYNGKAIPNKVFARGDSVGMLVVLENEDSERFALGVVQPRVPIAKAEARELPAGVVDDKGNFGGQAAKELKEECDLMVHESNMVDLIDAYTAYKGAAKVGGEQRKGYYPSMGGCDESLRLMYYFQKVTNAELATMKGKATGVLAEGEMIKLDVVPLNDFLLWGIQDGKVGYVMALYRELQAAGVLP